MIVEPATLTRRMRQRNHHRPVAETLAHAVLEPSPAEETRDRQLPDEDQHLRLQDPTLRLEPVSAVGDCRRRRLQVTGTGAVAAGKAAHERGDVGETPEFLGAIKSSAHHPSIELLAGAPREWPA